jgi:hypothetical protein
MREVYIFYTMLGFIAFLGLVVSLYQMFNKSRGKVYRAIVSAIGGTIFGISLIFLLVYNRSPETFLQEWTFINIIGFALCFVVPIFFMLTAGILVQFTVLEKWEEVGKNILNKLTKK